MSSPAPPDLLDRLAAGWRGYLLIALITLAAVLPGLARLPPLDRDESRFAQATAQMLETGDFVRLYVQEDPRHKKPVGIHWLQAASVAALSSVEAREIWAYRLPSLAGAILAALAAFWGGTALVGRRAAFLGASLLGACLLLSTEGMIAKTDAALCGFTTLALAALARLRMRDGGGGGLALIFWAALGAGVLIKGPITPMVAGLALLALFAWERKAAWMAPLARWTGPALAALITLPWLIAIGIATEGQFFAEALGGDLAPKLAGGGEHPFTPPGAHLLLLPLMIFPATLGLPAAAGLVWRAARTPAADDAFRGVRFLIAWAGPSFLVFELMPTKLVHYPLPTYPAIALLCGAGLAALLAGGKGRWAALAMAGIAAAGMAGAGAFLATLMPGGEAAAEKRAVQTAIVGGGLVLAWLAALALTRRPALWAALAVVAGLTVSYSLRERLAPEARTILVSREAALALQRAGLAPSQQAAGAPNLIISGYREPSLVFETATAAQLLNGAEAGAAGLSGGAALIEGREREAFEAALAARGLAFTPIGPPVAGQNYSNGDEVSLQPGRIARKGDPAG